MKIKFIKEMEEIEKLSQKLKQIHHAQERIK